MKREREVDNNIAMAKYLMLLSGGGGDQIYDQVNYSSNFNNRVFECKTCKRQFSSFQALGGHRASHKKPRLMELSSDGDEHHGSILTPTTKAKTHECSICGLEFGIGQALGGHMRRHRRTASSSKANNLNGNMHNFMTTTTTSSSNSGCSTIDNSTNTNSAKKNKGSTNRFLFLDLNLTPLENDLKFLKIGQSAPNLVDCFN